MELKFFNCEPSNADKQEEKIILTLYFSQDRGEVEFDIEHSFTLKEEEKVYALNQLCEVLEQAQNNYDFNKFDLNMIWAKVFQSDILQKLIIEEDKDMEDLTAIFQDKEQWDCILDVFRDMELLSYQQGYSSGNGYAKITGSSLIAIDSNGVEYDLSEKK